MITTGVARDTCQIDMDATLFAYYPFDSTDTLADYSANLANGIAGGISIIPNGRLNQAISFSTSTSYVQIPYFTSIRTTFQAYTVSLWIMPTVTMTGGSLIHISTTATGGGICYELLAFTGSGVLVAQHLTSNLVAVGIQGPSIIVNTWTHIAMTYSALHGIRLYINGQLIGLSSNANTIGWYEGWTPLFATLGNISPLGPTTPLNCNVSSLPILPGSYTGWMDDLRIYSREITADELCRLAFL